MKSGIFEIDGVEYPDADASDPIALGWMQGSPPPQAKLIRFQDDRLLEFPQIRWTLSHMRELAPTAAVWRGGAAPSDLGQAPHGLEAAIDALVFEDLQGRGLTWAQSLQRTYADGIVVLHRGRRIYERYFGALQEQRPHACFSITKSYAATLAAILIHERALDEARTVSHYLPEMAGTAYEDATLRQVLDMQIGVEYSELYADPKADIWDYARAGGLRPRADYAGPGNLYEYLRTLRKEGNHGAAFAYKTVNTEVLCWVMKRVTGVALPDMLSQRIWSQIGCEEDGYLTVDTSGVAMGGAGLSASLRDLCRFGELMRCEGAWCGKQVIPADVIADIRRGSDPAKFAMAGYTLLPGYSYRNMWWVSHNALGVFEGRGIHGQRLYIAPKAELVIARFCSHPVASSAANDSITLPAFAAMSRLLMAG
jgi:CubicO group peptidase (beta-lactamase class C family)